MSCKCLEEAEQKTLQHLKTANEKVKLISEGSFKNTTFLYAANPPRTQPYFEFEYTFRPWKVNGDLGQERKTIISILPVYCGFCGQRYEPDDIKLGDPEFVGTNNPDNFQL